MVKVWQVVMATKDALYKVLFHCTTADQLSPRGYAPPAMADYQPFCSNMCSVGVSWPLLLFTFLWQTNQMEWCTARHASQTGLSTLIVSVVSYVLP